MRLFVGILFFVLAGCKADEISKLKPGDTPKEEDIPKVATCERFCFIHTDKIEIRGFKKNEKYQIRMEGKTLLDDCDDSVEIGVFSKVPIYENNEDFFRALKFSVVDEVTAGTRARAQVFLYGPSCDLIQPPLFDKDVVVKSESEVIGEGDCKTKIWNRAIYFTF